MRTSIEERGRGRVAFAGVMLIISGALDVVGGVTWVFAYPIDALILVLLGSHDVSSGASLPGAASFPRSS
jgi:hypothetical protein